MSVGTVVVSTRNVFPKAMAAILLATSVAAQTPEPSPAGPPPRYERTTAPPERIVGSVTAVDALAGTITLQPDRGGAPVTVQSGASTQYRQAKPGATSLEGATTLTVADVKVGDRLLVVGPREGDNALQARQVVVMAGSDIADKQQRERMDWQRRGVAGVVTAVDPAKQEITLQIRAGEAPQTLVVATGEKKATFRRYSPESIKFSDAKPGTFADVVVGDQVRALGDRSEDGSRLAAEQVISGAFQTVVGAVEAVDAVKKELRIADVTSKAKLTVAIGPDTMLRRLPPEIAARMAALRGGPGGGEAEPSGGAPPAGGPPRDRPRRPEGAGDGPAGGMGGGRPRGGASLGDLLERLPALAVEELKAGDHIAISASRSGDASRLTAIALVAGVEPLITAQDSGRRQGGIDLMPGLPGGGDMGMGGF